MRIEVGSTRVFATAIDWPGWSRSARDEAGATDALVEHGPRYKAAIGKRIALPKSAKDIKVVERSKGSGNTDFGVPASPRVDAQPVDARELKVLIAILESCWAAFDAAVAAAKGKTLSTGPRGGGRPLAKIRAHALEGDHSYLSRLGGSAPPSASLDAVRAEFIDALDARRRGELPDNGPRGGARWTPREAVRRSAWHALDHAWEIEDRTQ